MNLIDYFDRYAQANGDASIGERELIKKERVALGIQRFAENVVGIVFTRRTYTSERLYQRLEKLGFVHSSDEYDEFLQLAMQHPPTWHIDGIGLVSSLFSHQLIIQKDKEGKGLVRLTHQTSRDE